MKTRNVMWGILAVLVIALATGSVLLLGYIAAAASFLTIIGLLLRRAIGHRALSSLHSFRTAWVDVRDREAA